jgi:hypothetical protein
MILLILSCSQLFGQHSVAITQNQHDDAPPIVNDHYMVWRTDEKGNFNIMLYDFERDTSYSITNISNNIFICLNDNYIAWNLQCDTDDEIMLHNIELNVSYPITDNLNDDIHPTMSGRYIAWESNNSYESNIILYDLQRSTSINVTNYRNNVMPQLDGQYLVWKVLADNDNSQEQIYLYNIATQETNLISTHPNIGSLKIKNGYIAWSATDAQGEEEIYLYDIVLKKRRRITNNNIPDNYLDLLPPYLVFNQNDGDDEVMLYHIDSLSLTQLTNNTTDDSFPVLNQHCVAWYSYGEYGMEEFLHYIDEQKTRQITCTGGFNLHVALNRKYMIWNAFDMEEMDVDIFMCEIPTLPTTQKNEKHKDMERSVTPKK